MRTQVEIEPNRQNWRKFCEEPELSEEEYQAWIKLAALASDEEAFFEYFYETTATEYAEMQKAEAGPLSWSNLANTADASRKWRRAEIVAYKTWLKGEIEIGEKRNAS